MKKALIASAIVLAIGIIIYFVSGGVATKNPQAVTHKSISTPAALPAAEITPKDIYPDAPITPAYYISVDQGSVRVKNFYLSNPPVVFGNTLSIYSDPKYSIQYDTKLFTFWLVVAGGLNHSNQDSAENGFLAFLGISKTDACKLKVWETFTDSAARTPLSFCGSVFK